MDETSKIRESDLAWALIGIGVKEVIKRVKRDLT